MLVVGKDWSFPTTSMQEGREALKILKSNMLRVVFMHSIGVPLNCPALHNKNFQKLKFCYAKGDNIY